MMFPRLSISSLVVLVGSGASAFTISPSSLPVQKNSITGLYGAKEDLVWTAGELKEKHGVFILDKAAKQELEDAVCALEKEASSSTRESAVKDFIGEWKLVCTSSSNLERPDFIPENPIRQALTKTSNKYVTVIQRIRSTNDDGVVDRVDNVIDYESPQQLGNLFDGLPEQLANLDLFNPLQISDTKIILAHNAKILDTYGDKSLFTTEISLSSVILNVAGESTVLDPKGKDVASINVPFANELGQSGTFETTYLDDQVRISRGRVANAIDQLRVFVRVNNDKAEQAQEQKETPVAEEEEEDYVVVEDDDSSVDVDNDEGKEGAKPNNDEEGEEEDPGVGGSDDYDLTPSA